MDDPEEVLIISKSDEIALEDGEIEEEEIIDPIVESVDTVVCDEPSVIEGDNLNDSDNDISDRLTVKPKKHKHHKKGVHRKRQISFDEISTTDCRKKPKSSDEYNENVNSHEESRPHSSDREECGIKEKSIEKCEWKQDSDNEEKDREKSQEFVGNKGGCSPMGGNISPVIKEKWGADSDEDSTKPSEGKFTSDWNNTKNTENSWGDKNEDNRNYGSRNEGNKNWNNNDNINKGWGDKSEENKGWGDSNDDNKGCGNRNENRRGRGNRNEGYNSWNNKNDNNNDWGNKNDDNNDGGNRNDDNNSWGNRRGGRNNWNNRNDDDNNGGNRDDDNNSWGNRRGGRNNWGNRNDDGNNRGFRNRGRGNWRNRNEDNNSWGNRNRGNDDWNNKGRDNDDWGNKNKDNDDWGNKNKENDNWGSKNRDNDDWGSKNNDTEDCGSKNKDVNEWNKGEETSANDNIVEYKSEEVVEKQTWNCTSDDDEPAPVVRKESFVKENIVKQSDDNDNKEPSINLPPAKPRDIDDFGKWGGFDSDDDADKPKVTSVQKSLPVSDETFDNPVSKGSPENCSKWNAYDSDDEANTTKPSTFQPQQRFNNDNNFNRNDSFKDTGGDKWNSKESSPKPFGANKWGNGDSDDESKNNFRDKNNDDDNNNSGRGNYNNFGKRPYEQRNNRNDNYNRNDNNNRGRGGGGGGGGNGTKKWPCKYFQQGSCRHGDNCSFIHESPGKNNDQKGYESKGFDSKGYEPKGYEAKSYESKNHEPKIQELCRFYEHQECYKRSGCSYMHEEFPCKLFHAGSKMCPSGDSCKYSHAPLNPETRLMLEKYLDEKIDERTDKGASSSIHDNSDYKPKIIGPSNDEMMSDSYFPDPMHRMYPQPQDPMKFPIRPWNSMMHYGEMPVPPQMEFMHRQRFMYDRFPHPMPGRMMPRGYRNMMPNPGPVGPMHDPYTGNPYTVTPLMSLYGGNPKVVPDMKDPYIDNLAQIVVGKESYGGPKDASMKRDMMDHNMASGNDDMDDYSMNIADNDCNKRSMPSPLKINSPEIPPGAYVPRTSMNAVQPNVRLGSGLPYGNEAAMMYGGGGVGGVSGGPGSGYPGLNNDPAMMDYINMAAIHYYHNQPDPMNYDKPWKLYILEVPVKIPYPLMNIDTQELPHKYTDPRLKGHPSVLNNNCTNTGTRQTTSVTEETLLARNHSEPASGGTPSIGSQLSSPGNTNDTVMDFERQMSNTFQYRISVEEKSPVFPISEDAFSFLGQDDAAKRVLDRSYLQDPRFKRKKVVNVNNSNSALEQSDIE